MPQASPHSSVLSSMAAPRRRSGYKYAEAMSASSRRHPDMQHPPDGYSLIEPDLHRATTSLEVESFPFLSQLKLRSAINLSAEAIHDQAIQFFLDSGIAMLNPRALESFEGPYDLWEEAAKESLELLLDADNHPMILLDSPTECESACLVGCLRRLQHWSMVAIHDEYHMMTMRETWYSTSQQFIERFDLDLVSLTANVPPWYRNHLTMLGQREEEAAKEKAVKFSLEEEEREAEAELSRRDPDRATRLWVHGHGAFSAALSSTPSEVQQEKEDENQQDEDKDKGKDKEGETSPEDLAGNSSPSPSTHTLARSSGVARQSRSHSQSQSQSQAASSSFVSDGQRSRQALPSNNCSSNSNSNNDSRSISSPSEEPQHVEEVAAADAPARAKSGHLWESSGRGSGSEEIGLGTGEGKGERVGKRKSAGVVTVTTVSDFRLNGFVHVCPLVSEGSKFTAKAWLQDEDD